MTDFEFLHTFWVLFFSITLTIKKDGAPLYFPLLVMIQMKAGANLYGNASMFDDSKNDRFIDDSSIDSVIR